MTESTPAEQAVESTSEAERRPSFGRRVGTAAIVLALAGGALLLAAAFLPRWWSHRIGDQADSSFASGIGLGLFYGFVFTLVPLLVLWWGFRRRRAMRTWLVVLCVAVLLAAPNLLTLGIVVGRGNAAHAGERTLDVEAPGFRTSVLIAAVAAVLAVLLVVWLARSRRAARDRERRLREELAEARGERTDPD